MVNIVMLIREVTAAKPVRPTKPQTPAQQRVSALQSQLAQARDSVKRQQLAARQARLNQARAALSKPIGQ
jgi:hypothetical protein